MACWTLVRVTNGFILPPPAPDLSLSTDRLTAVPWAKTTTRTMGSTGVVMSTWLCAKKKNKKEKKEEEEAAKKSDVLYSDFFQSVSGFFKDAEKQKPSRDDRESGFWSSLRWKSKKKDNSIKKAKKSIKESSPAWNLFSIASNDARNSGDTPLSETPNGESRSSSNIFKEAAERVIAEASKKGISSIDLRQTKEVDGAKLKQRPKAATKSTAKTKVSKTTDSVSSNSNLLRRMQDLLPLNSSNSAESSNPLSAMQKIAGSVLKLNAEEKVKEEWVPVFPKTRIMPGEMVPVTVGGIDLLVIASNDGQSLYCIANSCPHLGTPLETGQLTRLPVEVSSVSSSTTTRTAFGPPEDQVGLIFSETDVAKILSQDGCEDCIVCPLHKTAFALQSGEVRGEWCPYPPVLGKVMGTVKQPTAAAVFDIRTKGKNIEVRLNSVVSPREDPKNDTG